MAVIDGFRKGFLWSAEVDISMELMTSFRNIWHLLVDTKHVPNFALPFFHLGSEPSGIWELIPFTGKTIPVTKSNSIKSFRVLRETVAFAALSRELFQALSDSSQRNELEHAILQRYFQDKASDLARPYRLWSDCLKEEILYDPAENYARKDPQLKDYSPDGGIRKFEGQQLLLPPTERFHPSKERLRKHLMRFER
ncbi:MAG: hypothetical protein AAGU19_22720 [Prolixibacteraceae bacterium]